jgi:creatinine amidohydrolase
MTDRLHAMTSVELGDLSPSIVLIPLGATEQHGPHLPLSTDTTIAIEWANSTAAGLNANGMSAVVAPPLPYGSSGEHQMFPGTLSIGQQALETLLVELIRSASADFDRVALLSGHAGNLAPVTRAAEQMSDEGHDVTHLFPTWSQTEADSVDAHAGRTETSLMLHLDPSSVRTAHVSPGQTRPLSELMDALVADGVGAVSENGVLGDPTQASAAEGKQLFDILVSRTVDRLLSPLRTADE